MKTKFNWILTLLLAFIVHFTYAQTKAISGTVSDETGPLPGVSIIKKGTSKGTETDFDGKYTIEAKSGDVLVFSFVGMKTVNKTVGSSNKMNITMESDNVLEEVIVTAQGIKREAKALGYSVKTIKAEGLEQKAEGDVARVLSGKIAGVNITSSNGLSGSSTNIVIRGFSSITGSNQPLFVVDGIPFDSGTNNQSNFLDGNTQSSRFLDLDPNSIESISVLKGLSATVLYGSAGRNGVILIVTKNSGSGKTKNKTEVSVNQSIFVTEANLPKYQDNYGGGFHQGFGFFFSNWGSRFDRTDDDGVSQASQYVGDASNGNAILRHPFNFIADQSLISGYENLLDSPYEYKPYNGVEDFFRTGTVISTSVNVRGGNDKANFNINYGRNDDEGVTLGNSVLRNNFGMGGNAKLSNGLNVAGSFNFSRTDYKSPPNAASFGSGTGFDGGGVFGDVLYTPRSVDLTNIPFESADGRSVYYRAGNDIQNPYWTVKNAKTSQKTDRFFGSLTLSYNFTDWLSASYRTGLDTYTEFNTYGQNKGGVDGDTTGLYRTITARNTNWDHNLVFSSDNDINNDFNLKTSVGFNARSFQYQQDGLESTGQLSFGVLQHFNFATNSSVNSFSGLDIADQSRQNTVGIYFDSTLAYKDYLYLNAVARNDWSSTLESENNSIFYPGASVSFIPTNAFEDIKGNSLNYLKIRFGYGTSAGFPDAYNTRNILGLNSRAFINNDGATVSANFVDDTLGNPDLEPELDQEFEFGIDTKLFNRLNFNVSLFRKKTTNLITDQALDPSTGFDTQQVNIGEILNKGIEVDFNADIIKASDNGFSWNLAGNYSTTETTVVDLPDGVDRIALTNNVIGQAANYAVEGSAFGVLYGTTILRDGNGNKIVGADGKYVVDVNISEIGDPNPDWTAALIPTFRYKNFNLSANLQYRHGGDIYSTTAAALIGRGVVDSDNPIDRESSYILPGVTLDGSQNNTAITSTQLGFDTYFGGPNEVQIFDGTTIRLQEVSIGYVMPKESIEGTPFGSISFTFSGFNLWYRAVNFDRDLNYDTNASSTGVGNGQGIDFITGPSTRRVGLSVKATF